MAGIKSSWSGPSWENDSSKTTSSGNTIKSISSNESSGSSIPVVGTVGSGSSGTSVSSSNGANKTTSSIKSSGNTLKPVGSSGTSGNDIPVVGTVSSGSSTSGSGSTSSSTGSSGSTASPENDWTDENGMPIWIALNNSYRESMGMNTINYNAATGEYYDKNYVPVYSPYIDYGDSSLNPAFVEQILKTGNSPTNYEGYEAADPNGSDYYAQYYGMSAEDQALLKLCGEGYNSATNDSARAYWHAQAEAIRAKYGYSGGKDGSQNLTVPQSGSGGSVKLPTSSGNAAGGLTTGPTNGSATGGFTTGSGYDLTEYLKQQAAAKMEADLANLKYAYEKSMAGYDATAEKLPQTYDTARNSAAAQNALAKQYFNEYAAASGLSSGAAGQAALAQSSTYQRNISNLDQAQANALSEIDLNKSDLQREYEYAIAEAEATGNSDLASALYQELIRVQGLERADAQFAAQLEMQQQAVQWERELAERQMEMAERELALQYQELLGGQESSDANDTYLDYYYPSYSGQSNSTGTQSSGRGYDNGSLSADQIKTLQAYYGLTQDGMWGPNSQSTTGMSADEAWSLYLLTQHEPKTVAQTLPQTQWFGKDNQQSTIPSYMLAETYYPNGTSNIPNSDMAVAGSGYAEVLADIQNLQQNGASEITISNVIAQAQADGRITAAEAVKLQMGYGVRRY